MSEIEGPKEAMLRRLKEAKEKSAALEDEIREKSELKELEEKVRFEENKARDLPYIQAAEEEHREIRVVNTPMGAIAVKKPNQFHFKKFAKRASSAKGLDDDDVWTLARQCIVYPDIPKVETIVEEYPGVTAKLGEKIVELGNGAVKEFEGK